MDLSLLISFPFLLMSLMIAAVTYVIRNGLEAIWQLEEKKLWNNTILPCLPIIIGLMFGLIFIHFPYPVLIGVSLSGRLCFGAVAGLVSSKVYRVVNSLLEKEI